jgi:hypothetical protein
MPLLVSKDNSPAHLSKLENGACTILGFFLGLGLIKLGNPIILNAMVELPTDRLAHLNPNLNAIAGLFEKPAQSDAWMDILIKPWPLTVGLWIAGCLALITLPLLKQWPRKPLFLIGTGCFWLAWQALATVYSVKVNLSWLTLAHFVVCALFWLIGFGLLSSRCGQTGFWLGLGLGYSVVLWYGFGQHYGGLEAVRREIYELPNWQMLPSEVIKRFTSHRIFSTLFYPNALAGIILLLFPPLFVVTWHKTARLSHISRGVICGFLAYASAACLIWSGSKSGWLIALALIVLILLQLRWPKALKRYAILVTIMLGMLGFGWKFAGYFERGSTSAVARLDYWHAALQIALTHPLLGTGPGTFGIGYAKLKHPDSEMTKLVHNDYLEQACDSGWLGFISYSLFFWGCLGCIYRYITPNTDPLYVGICLGLLGWALHGFLEFGLYIPASAWPAFALLGLCFRQSTQLKG